MNTTTIIAWWGAILSSVVFLWDIYKWRTAGARIRFTVQAGMKSINMPEYEGKTLILANVTNYGNQPTTITNLGFLHFKSIWSQLKKRPDDAFIIATPSTTQPLPFELKQGSVWSGITIQDEQLAVMSTQGRLYCVLYHSHDAKPIKARVTIRSNLAVKRGCANTTSRSPLP